MKKTIENPSKQTKTKRFQICSATDAVTKKCDVGRTKDICGESGPHVRSRKLCKETSFQGKEWGISRTCHSTEAEDEVNYDSKVFLLQQYSMRLVHTYHVVLVELETALEK